MTLSKITQVILVVLLAFLLACGGESQQQEKSYDYKRDDSLSIQYLSELGNIRISIEESAKLNELLKKKGYSYNSTLRLPTEKVSEFSSIKQQSVALGAYGSDMSYAAVFGQTQDAMNILNSIMVLADQLGVENAFSKDVMEKLASADSTVDKSVLLTEAYLRAEDQLHSNERAQYATMMVVGGWIEGVYISAALLHESRGDEELNNSFWSHVYTYNNVSKMLGVFDDNPDCNALAKELESLKEPVETIVDAQGEIRSHQIDKLYEAIKKVRNNMM